VGRELRRRETGSGTDKFGRSIAVVVLRRAVSKSFISSFIFGIFSLRSVWNIAASLIIEIVGVLFTRTSQKVFEKASTYIPHKNLHYPLGIWNPPSKN
jgi:hypothetical protein